MSFEVLARKWRPQTFDEVIGQDHITLTLKKAVQMGRISHAYLLSGPRGCGKTSTARILAKVINCTDLKDGNPCDQCLPCVGVIQGKNLDVMEIDGATHTGVSEVRDLQVSIGYAPSQHRNKVYIIDEVHMLSANAFNALLKTLEEPPRHVYFIFATTAPHKIPETIKSRCQRHHFKRLEIREIAGQLSRICEAEGVKHEKEALRLLARKAEGSMRDGESLLDQCITASSSDVTTRAVKNILGMLDEEMVFFFLKTISGKDPAEVLRALDQAVDAGVDLQELSGALLEGFRDLMILAAPGDLVSLIFRSAEEVEQLETLLPNYELPDLVTIVERLCNLGPRLKMASDPRILLESTLVDLTLLDRQTDIRMLINKINDLEGGGSLKPQSGRKKAAPDKGGVKAASPAEAGSAKLLSGWGEAFLPLGTPEDHEAIERKRPESTRESASREDAVVGNQGDLSLSQLKGQWDRFIADIRQKKVSLGVCLISGQLAGFDGRKVVLRFNKNFYPQMSQIEESGNIKFIRGVMKRSFGRELDLVCIGEGDDVSTSRPQEEPKGNQGNTDVRRLPITQKILRDFDGEFV